MESTKIKLYVGADFVSAFAMSAFVALKEKQLSFEIVTLDLKSRENYQASYRDLSLTCKIPTLIHQGFALSESSAIAEYLEEIAPGHNRLLPLDIKQRARARQLQAWLRSDLLVIRKERPADLIYFGKKDNPLSDDALAAVDRLFFVADRLLEGGAEHLFGDWSIADTDLAIMLNRLVANGDQVPSRLAAYVRRQWDRDSVRAWMDIERAAPAIQ
jgi:glutathione S-transferase